MKKEKIPKNNYKKLRKKTSFKKLYKDEISIAFLIILIIAFMISVIFSKIARTVYLFALMLICSIEMIDYVIKQIIRVAKWMISRYHQTKLPLTKEELNSLDIKTIKEYADFLDEYLYHNRPKLNLMYLITIHTIINFSDEFINNVPAFNTPNFRRYNYNNNDIIESFLHKYFIYDNKFISVDAASNYFDSSKVEFIHSKEVGIGLCCNVFADTCYEKLIANYPSIYEVRRHFDEWTI